MSGDGGSGIIITGMRRIMSLQLMTDRIYDSGPIRLYYNTTMLQMPTVLSTVTCCTGLQPRSNR
jgi:hypothetical protein